ncbi:AAA family ATPase [Kutzneria kofuensis]|uniref:DNA-binding CsgD family transcriptional regulator n=1 Tax=Kutzneria kofuensis TaxID=103725 RepID=A0A7W9KLZ9_9PSEU|nr:LuxR family transcriptional regulator [Kutzneria kofuensis]MBB5894927.1 DNA-binding CsgD family transcriptional regulator [Kutzneria kofuensis]
MVIGTPFVGRRRELDLLRGKLFDPRPGAARFVGVTGGPGLGKTRLLAEFAAVARDAGVPVVAGRASEFERHVPFGVLSGDSSSTVDIHDPIDVERYRVHRAIRSRLVELAAPAGLALLLDDVHWADDASLELLDHLVRHPPRARVVIVAAYRPRQAPPRLSAALSDGVEEIELGALTFAEARELFGDDLDRARYAAAAGNPLYLEALARHPDADGHGALAAELATLGHIDLQVARAVAVVADVAEPTLVAAAADLSLAETLAALDRLTERDLLRPLGTSGGVRYRHPLLRSVVYQGIGSGWRFSAHARTAAALAARKAPATVRAHHVEQSAVHGDKAAIDVLVEAAVAYMNTAPSTAAHWLGAALRLLPAEPAVPRAQVVGFCAQIERLLGRHAEAHALVLGELNGLSDPDSAAAAVLKLELAAGGLVGGNFAEVRDWAREALATARRVGDAPLLAATTGGCVQHAYIKGVMDDEVLGLLDESTTMVDSLLDNDLARHLDAVLFLGWNELVYERLDGALRHLARGLQLARATGQNHLVTYLRIGQGTAYGLLGQLHEAAACFDDAAEAALLTRSDELRTMALAQQAWIVTWLGDPTEGVRLGTEAVRLAGPVRDWFSGVAHGMLAQAKLYAGDPAGAVELLRRAGGDDQLSGFEPVTRVSYLELLAAAEAECGRPEEAMVYAELAQKVAGTLGRQLPLAFAGLARAHPLRAGSPSEAAEHALAAAEKFAHMGDRVDSGRARLVAAGALAAAGRAKAARHEGDLANSLFRACGAALFERMAGRLEPAVRVLLTPRELTVLALAAESLTAEAIARRLGIATGTVQKHLENAYRKLGTGDRLTSVLRAQALGLLPRAETQSH